MEKHRIGELNGVVVDIVGENEVAIKEARGRPAQK